MNMLPHTHTLSLRTEKQSLTMVSQRVTTSLARIDSNASHSISASPYPCGMVPKRRTVQIGHFDTRSSFETAYKNALKYWSELNYSVERQFHHLHHQDTTSEKKTERSSHHVTSIFDWSSAALRSTRSSSIDWSGFALSDGPTMNRRGALKKCAFLFPMLRLDPLRGNSSHCAISHGKENALPKRDEWRRHTEAVAKYLMSDVATEWATFRLKDATATAVRWC